MVMPKRAAVLLGLLVAPGMVRTDRLEAHPLHSSYTEITRERTGSLMIQVRLFGDDFGALLESLEASSGATRELAARQYVQRQLIVTRSDGAVIPTAWCGMRSEQNVVWVCIRTVNPISGAFRIRNALMFDRFPDQISIIRFAGRKETRTLVLSARVPEVLLE